MLIDPINMDGRSKLSVGKLYPVEVLNKVV